MFPRVPAGSSYVKTIPIPSYTSTTTTTEEKNWSGNEKNTSIFVPLANSLKTGTKHLNDCLCLLAIRFLVRELYKGLV